MQNRTDKKKNLRKAFYLIYIIFLLAITAFLSIQIINGKISITGKNMRFEYETIKPKMPSRCPCQNIGIEPSHCPVLFMRPSKNPLLHYELIPNFEQVFDAMEYVFLQVLLK